MVIKDLIIKISNDFNNHFVDNALFEANLIVKTVLNLSSLDVVLKGKEAVLDVDLKNVLNATGSITVLYTVWTKKRYKR